MFHKLVSKLLSQPTNVAVRETVTFNAPGNYDPKYGKQTVYVAGKAQDAGTNPAYTATPGGANYNYTAGSTNYNYTAGGANYSYIAGSSYTSPGSSYTSPGNSYTSPGNSYTSPGSSYTTPGTVVHNQSYNSPTSAYNTVITGAIVTMNSNPAAVTGMTFQTDPANAGPNWPTNRSVKNAGYQTGTGNNSYYVASTYTTLNTGFYLSTPTMVNIRSDAFMTYNYVDISTASQNVNWTTAPGNQYYYNTSYYNTTYNTPITSYNSPVTSYNSPVTSYNSPVTSYNSPTTSYNSPYYSVAGYNSPTYNIAGYNSPTYNVAGYNSPTYNMTGYNSPTAGTSMNVFGVTFPGGNTGTAPVIPATKVDVPYTGSSVPITVPSGSYVTVSVRVNDSDPA